MKRVLAAAAIALAIPASAQAGTITATTSNGKSCTIETVTEPERFGLSVAPCVAKRAAGVAFLYDPGSGLSATKATNTRLPYSNFGRPGDNSEEEPPEIIPGVPGLPELPELPVLPELPELPDLPGLPGTPEGGSRTKQVTIQMALFLEQQNRKRNAEKVKWRRKAGGKDCKRNGPTVLSCTVVAPVK